MGHERPTSVDQTDRSLRLTLPGFVSAPVRNLPCSVHRRRGGVCGSYSQAFKCCWQALNVLLGGLERGFAFRWECCSQALRVW